MLMMFTEIPYNRQQRNKDPEKAHIPLVATDQTLYVVETLN